MWSPSTVTSKRPLRAVMRSTIKLGQTAWKGPFWYSFWLFQPLALNNNRSCSRRIGGGRSLTTVSHFGPPHRGDRRGIGGGSAGDGQKTSKNNSKNSKGVVFCFSFLFFFTLFGFLFFDLLQVVKHPRGSSHGALGVCVAWPPVSPSAQKCTEPALEILCIDGSAIGKGPSSRRCKRW